MNKLLFVSLLSMILSGCGYASRDNEAVGQVKKVVHVTPIFCPERYDVDISLGVLRNGVGSMSTQDIWLTVNDKGSLEVLKKANETGTIVKINYNDIRTTLCQKNLEITKTEKAN